MTKTPLSPVTGSTRSPRGRGVFRVLLAAVVIGLPACATKGDIAEVTSAVDGLRAQAARNDSILAQLGQTLVALQDTVTSSAGREVDGRGTIARDIREIRSALTRLEQLTGQIQAQVTRLEQRVDQGFAEIPELPTSNVPDSLRDQLRSDAGQDRDTPPASQGDPDEIFELARGAFERGSLVTARRAFEQYLQMAPNAERAPGAWYSLGDIAEQEDRLDDAVSHFLHIPEYFPSSDSVPGALYRAGQIEVDRGNTDAGREHLQRVVGTYPDSTVAELAREILDRIG